MIALTAAEIADAFQWSCRAELGALKPGNVHVHAAGHGMEVAQFEAAAAAAAPHLADPRLNVGARIRRAVAASLESAHCNTNLGIILLCAPLAAAAERSAGGSLQERTRAVLSELDARDAADVYAAIRQANPGGLGKSDKADVGDAPPPSLLDAMALAAPRDRIAANYVSGFRDIFEDHLPTLIRIRDGGGGNAVPSQDDAVATLYLSLLARYPDSHIRRKFGIETAAHVQQLAKAAKPLWRPAVTPRSYPGLMDLDGLLKSQGWNPGTTADFVVATLFAARIAPTFVH
ncbi:MAG: triphosphoribosyl-dephospho-CoA synthase [Hyphomicrobiaceae bacterium]|nr:triphosphoribosyl-dephospho-CoA synthase [Hyphomicrobiaceae bacterium]